MKKFIKIEAHHIYIQNMLISKSANNKAMTRTDRSQLQSSCNTKYFTTENPPENTIRPPPGDTFEQTAKEIIAPLNVRENHICRKILTETDSERERERKREREREKERKGEGQYKGENYSQTYIKLSIITFSYSLVNNFGDFC